MTRRLRAEDIVNKTIPVDLIDANKQNYNQHPDEQIAQLAASHEEFGQYRSIVVWERPDGRYTQVAGHGYLQAAIREGVLEVRADILPPETDEKTISAILVADNLHAQNSSPDDELLAQLLQEQADAGFDLSALGTDDEALRQMLYSLDSLRVNQGTTYEDEVIDGSTRGFGLTPDERLDRYNTTDIRQIVLLYQKDDYSRVVAIFAEVRKIEGVETNTDAMTILLEEYVRTHELEDVLCGSQPS